ncbi:MAG: porin [Rubrivivax sp.]|nr:porin [Rubrivivax sp.]
MKKSLLALAALTAFAGAASAQSSVTLYGRVDLSVAKNVGSDAKAIQNGSGSRLGLRGTEDLGGGLSALFNIEHRFNADTGADTSGNVRFWNGRSIVGLQGGFGQVVFGREYTTAFLGTQLIGDPWGWDTVAAALGTTNGTTGITGLGGIAKVRNDSSVTYKIAAAGFSFGAQIAEATDSINTFAAKPVNFNLGYGAGPLTAAFGYEKTGREAGNIDEKMWSAMISYNLGFVKPGFYYGKGTALNGADHKGMMFTATAPIGAGEFRAAYGTLKANDTTVTKALALGYHYSMSKRTTLYVDFLNNSEAATSKSGYDVGIKHNF